MTTLLRRNLTCFYCGGRSPCPTLEKLHHFKCPKCEAVNYLDENGEITDPPALETPTSPHQYAHLVPRATSPELGAQDGELFCQNCQKNQFLLTQALAEYLPPQNDPKYAEYEAASEQYRRSLEDRYPQVCINCAPRVQNRLRAAGYAAKTDHLRRMMEKTRHGPVYPAGSSWGWRNLIVFLGGGTYLWSILLGLLWHIFGALMRQEDGTSAVGVLGFRVCLEQAAKEHSVEPKCFVFVIPMAQYALVLGVLSFWWNYKLQDKVRGSGGRMVGLWSYLRLQILVLAVRAASLWYLQNVLPIKNALEIFRAAHSFMIVFILLTTILSIRVVKIDHTPPFSFNQPLEPLLPTPPSSQIPSGPPRPPDSSFDTLGASIGSSFPVEALAPTPSNPVQYPPSPTITATASDTSDTETEVTWTTEHENRMDWTPTSPAIHFQPRRSQRTLKQQRQRQPVVQPVRPSPFHGTLPPAPKAPAARLANPFPQPVFQAASASSQQDFWAKMRSTNGNWDGNAVASSLGSAARVGADGQPLAGEMKLQEPQLRIREHVVDTGLEAMFDSVFSIRDNPAEVEGARGDGRGKTQERRQAAGHADTEGGWWAFGQVLLIGCLPIGVGIAIVWWKGWY